MDDATGKHYSTFFIEEEGTASSFQGVHDVIEAHGLLSSFYSDRGSHYWHTPEAGGKVDQNNHTQFVSCLGLKAAWTTSYVRSLIEPLATITVCVSRG